MKNNTDLNEEKLSTFANAAVQYNIEKQLRSKYDKILADNKSFEKKTFVRWSTIAKVAAVTLVILSGIFLMKKYTFTPSVQTTAQNFLDQTYISGNPDITRKGASVANQTRREANAAFMLKDFPLAIAKYESLQTQDNFSTLDQFYLGISHLKTNNFSKSIDLFSEIKASKNFEIEEIDWLLSLAFILSNQEENAISLLKKIKTDNSYKSKEAAKLLNAIQ